MREGVSLMAFEHTWRWFGPNDSITLPEIKQTGAVGIVTALHQIPLGEVWTVDEIEKRKTMIQQHGLYWSVVESLPVHENIKKQKGNYKQLIENYKTSLRNLAQCGIDTVCYNFMPVLDWSRTDLQVIFKDGSITSRFDYTAFAAFDVFILQRKNAGESYSPEQLKKAEEYYRSLTDSEKEKLINTILLGLPGSLEAYTLDQFKKALEEYNSIDASTLRLHLAYFIKEVAPVAEENGINLVIHPDDPPFSLLGLPRIVGTREDLLFILNAYNSPANGLTLCTGSLGAGYFNDVALLAQEFATRINFLHLRNVTRTSDGNFMENDHLAGDVDMFSVIKTMLLEQQRRINEGRKDTRLPMRPDHGRLMIPDMNRKGIYPGYSLFGRMRGLAELRGMEIAITRMLAEQSA